MTIQAKCPGCQAILRIPSDWVHKAVRCKRCGTIVRAETRAAVPAPPGRKSTSPAKPSSVAKELDALADAPPPAAGERRSVPAPSWKRLTRALLWAVGLIGIGAIAFVATPGKGPIKDVPNAEHPPEHSGLPAATGPFPRRMLAVNVSNYLYFDPINPGVKPRDTHTILTKFGEFLHVPGSQFLELSDAAPGKQAAPPMKGAIEKAITDFLGSSRTQDRVMLFFSGHAVEVEDQPYLVPLEGESADAKTLIPLTWVLEQLGKCPARQKVFVADFCHIDPSRGAQRPGSGPLGEKTDAALANPPPGVQVWSSCVAGQFSYDDPGPIFLTALNGAMGTGGEAVRLGIQKPTDSLPLELLNAKVSEEVQREVGLLFKEKQTARLSGAEKTETTAGYDPNEPLPSKIALDWKPTKSFVAAPKPLIDEILKDAAAVPPVRIQATNEQLSTEMFPLFALAIMNEYQRDNAKNAFRDAVTQARDVLRKHAKAYPEEFRGDVNALKKRVAGEQKKLALATLDLEESLKKLQAAAKLSDEEKSKRWRAYYDFVLARLMERIAYTYEYNFMLANIRTDSMPELVAGKHTGWRLASREKMQARGEEGRHAKKYASDAKEVLKRLAEEHKGTPYEVLAKRDASNALGLEWRPTR